LSFFLLIKWFRGIIKEAVEITKASSQNNSLYLNDLNIHGIYKCASYENNNK
jgi:hypothetical protein